VLLSGNKGTKPSQSVDDFKPDAADASEFFNSEIKESPENQVQCLWLCDCSRCCHNVWHHAV